MSDRVISAVTRSQYSHVEMMIYGPTNHNDGCRRAAASSSGRDRGVRQKEILFEPDKWDFVELPWARLDAYQRILSKRGAKYDWLGLLFSQFFNLRRNDQDRWFCSEINAWAIGLDMPQTYSPGDLMRIVREHNRTYILGQRSIK